MEIFRRNMYQSARVISKYIQTTETLSKQKSSQCVWAYYTINRQVLALKEIISGLNIVLETIILVNYLKMKESSCLRDTLLIGCEHTMWEFNTYCFYGCSFAFLHM